MNTKAYLDLLRSILMTFGGLLVAQGITDNQTLTSLIGALTTLGAGGWSFTQNDGAVRDLGRSVLMLVGGVLVKVGFTDQQTAYAMAGALSTLGSLLWTGYEHKIKPDATVAKVMAFVVVLPFLSALGGCVFDGVGVNKAVIVSASSNKGIAKAELALAAANVAVQAAIENGLIKAKDAPKYQAAIHAATLVLDTARQAVADGRVDASDLIDAAFVAATNAGRIEAEYQGK